MPEKSKLTKHEQVSRAIRTDIGAGRWRRGERLPSEADLVERFGVSRITVGRAMRDLQREGLIERRRGSGSYVRKAGSDGAYSFGLLIPNLGETEIFEPMCRGMMASSQAAAHALVWGSPSAGATREERAWELCRQYIRRDVSGVFFAPLELTPGMDEINGRISDALGEAGIPVVLLDRTVTRYPERGPHDLVGIDNRRAGFVITAHLARAGGRRIAFAGFTDSAATVDARRAGYLEALHREGLPIDPLLLLRMDPDEEDVVARVMKSTGPDSIVCANDRMAAHLMHALIRLGYEIPGDVRIVGIDDLDYARLLPVPLTTYRQPVREIGEAALSCMLDRIERPAQPIRDVLVHGELVVRDSCGM